MLMLLTKMYYSFSSGKTQFLSCKLEQCKVMPSGRRLLRFQWCPGREARALALCGEQSWASRGISATVLD